MVRWVWVAGLVLLSACSGRGDQAPGAGAGGAAGVAGATGGAGGSGGASGSGGTAGTQSSGGSGGAAGDGSGGSGGSGGSAGGGGTGGASGGQGGTGGEPRVDDPACEPATLTFGDEWSDAVSDCFGNEAFFGIESRVPNPLDNFMDELVLDAPLAAGAVAAVSMELSFTGTRGNLEIWGSASAEVCGPVDELLWYGAIESRRLCAEFTPSQATSRLRWVWRQLEVLQGQFSGEIADIAVCATGSCPGATSGTGRTTEAISAPVGVYEIYGGGAFPFASGLVWSLGGRRGGKLIATWEGTEDPLAHTLTGGFVRTPPYDPFGDAAYCVGEGSRIVATPDSEDAADTVELRNLTRLPSCENGTGTASITDVDNVAQINTTIAGYAMIDADAMDNHCQGRDCQFLFKELGDGTDYRSLVLHLRTAEDVYYNAAPTLVESDITEAFWVLVRADGSMELSCASGGSLYFDPDGETTVSLTGIGEPVPACPGETVEPDMLDIFVD